MIFKTKKYPAIKQSYCVVASYRLAAHASMIVGRDNLPVLNCKTKKTVIRPSTILRTNWLISS